LGSAFIGLLDILAILDLTIGTAVTLGWRVSSATPVAIIIVIISALFYIAFIFGLAEYHYRNIGQPNSWKLFSVTILGQLFILILPYLFF
jgi:hypothetical protein